jgi:integrase
MKRMTLPAHLIQNRYGFCFRITVPPDLQKVVGKVEIRWSLKTGNVKIAKERSIWVGLSVQRYFDETREAARMKKDITPEETAAYIGNRIQEMVDANNKNPAIKEIREKVRHAIVYGVDPNPPIIVRPNIIIGGNEIAQGAGIHSGNYKPEPEHLISLKTLIRKYEEWQLSEGNWTEDSAADIVPYLKWFLKYMGDVPIDTITEDHLGDFKMDLRKLPPNWSKTLRFKKLSIQEIANLQHERTLGNSTVSNTMAKIGAMFGHAVNKHRLPKNPCNTLIKGKKPKPDKWKSFTDEDLRAIFHSKQYLAGSDSRDSFKEAFDFWLPILGAFTGARLNELCQLHVDDIREHHGILCISINKELEKKYKNDWSKREVPLHSFLLKMGFHRYVEEKRKAGYMLVFHTLTKGKKGYQHVPSNHFAKFLDSIGIGIDRKKVFHSWRYTVINHLNDKGVDTTQISDIVGHDKSSVSGLDIAKPVVNMTARYLERGFIESVKKNVEKINYSGLDLNHLLKSKFARPRRRG